MTSFLCWTMSEQTIVRAILDYLRLAKIFHWRNNTGAMVDKENHRFFRFGATGSPDIFVVVNGQIIGIEVKSETGKQSENQKIWQSGFERAGGKYLLVRSVDEVVNIKSYGVSNK